MDNYFQWSKVLQQIKEQTSPANFRTWFAPTFAEINGEGKLVIYTPSAFVMDQLSIKYLPILQAVIQSVYHKTYIIEFRVDPSKIPTKKTEVEEEQPEEEFSFQFSSSPTPAAMGINPKYTLDNFVVGLSNNVAYAAAQAVIQNPGTSYNPLFLYGGTGVGKTHLMHAVGNALLTKNPNLKIVYCSTEDFTNDFIQSIQTKRTNDFRNKYRSCDLLLIDDIQFISGRDSTQEEFFHTFNALHAKNAQILITSDRPPMEMQKLESRLMSRFQGGLMIDIQIPDFDTRVAILRAKCQERGDVVSEECLTLIAANVETNARELEGKLMQIVQTCKLRGLAVTVEEVQRMLGQTPSSATPQRIDHRKVISSVNQYFNIKTVDLTGPKRKKELVFPRQLVMYLLYEDCRIPFERIGDLLGGRDHTTIMHGVDKIRQNIQRDREVQRIYIEVKQLLTS
jgi:chromosomal replication initiator protein